MALLIGRVRANTQPLREVFGAGFTLTVAALRRRSGSCRALDPATEIEVFYRIGEFTRKGRMTILSTDRLASRGPTTSTY